MSETEGILATNQDQLLEVSQNLTPVSDDQEYMRDVHHGRLVSDVIDELNEGSIYYKNQWCKITLLPRLVIDEQLLVPINTCYRLIAFQETIEQDERGDEARKNYIPSPVLTEAELFLRIYPRWMLDKNTGTVYAIKGRAKEPSDELDEIETLDFDTKDINDDAYVFDSSDDKSNGAEPTAEDSLDDELLADDNLTLLKDEPDESLDNELEDDEARTYTIDDGDRMQEEAIMEQYQTGETLEDLAEEHKLSLPELSKLVVGIVQEDTPEEESEKTESGREVRKAEWNESKKRLVWYYE